MNGEKPLQRHENNHQQQQPDGKPEEVCRERKKMMLQLLEDNFHAGDQNEVTPSVWRYLEYSGYLSPK
jgi:hypothetical protein